MRKGKIIAVLAAGLLTVSALGGTALAHWNSGGANSDAVNQAIATQLGIDQQTVANAFTTVADQARSTAVANKLAALVKSGVLTQDEADSIQQWYDSAPAALDKLQIGRGHSQADLQKVADILGVDLQTLTNAVDSAQQQVAADNYKAMLDQAVTDGKITQAQADQLLSDFQAHQALGAGAFGGGFGPMEHGGRGGRSGPRGGMRGFGGFGGFGFGFGAPPPSTVPAPTPTPSGSGA